MLKARKEWKKGREELDNRKAEEREREKEPERMEREKGEGRGEVGVGEKICRRDTQELKEDEETQSLGKEGDYLWIRNKNDIKPRQKQNLLTKLVNI